MSKDMGASADADRAGGLRPEPAPQSQPKALVPSAEMLATFARAEQPFKFSDYYQWDWTTQPAWIELMGNGLVEVAGAVRHATHYRITKKGRAASVDTLPKGRDPERGSVRSKGGAVPSDSEGDAQP